MSPGSTCQRLRNVQLRGFPDVKIYNGADINIRPLSSKQIAKTIFTPQLSVYRPELEKVEMVDRLFLEEGVNIFGLEGGFDYVATDEKGEETEWTIIPPVVEVLPFRFDSQGRIDYSGFIGNELRKRMQEKGYEENPELQNLIYPNFPRGLKVDIPEICDGSHRIEVARRKSLEQAVLFINVAVTGFPYYAAPQPYNKVHEEPERVEEKIDKVHVLTSPGHKVLYRLFPSGGINSGNVRPLKQRFD